MSDTLPDPDFPEKYLLVDMLNNLERLPDNTDLVLRNLKSGLSQFDPAAVRKHLGAIRTPGRTKGQCLENPEERRAWQQAFRVRARSGRALVVVFQANPAAPEGAPTTLPGQSCMPLMPFESPR